MNDNFCRVDHCGIGVGEVGSTYLDRNGSNKEALDTVRSCDDPQLANDRATAYVTIVKSKGYLVRMFIDTRWLPSNNTTLINWKKTNSWICVSTCMLVEKITN